MPYRLRYQVWVDWYGAGIGPMAGQLAPMQGASGGASGMQTLELFNVAGGQNVPGSGTNGQLATADIITLLNGTGSVTGGMCLDLSNQMNAAATLARLQGFNSGSP